jgi:LPS export ABC transporter protein LptC
VKHGLRRSGIPALLGLGAILAAGLPLAACSPDEGSGGRVETGDLPEQQIYDYRLIESEDGIRQWVLDSERMDKFAQRDELELYGVKMQFYRDGEYFSTLTSERGRANPGNNNLFCWGDVLVVTEDGRRLETEELHYDDAKGLIHNDVFNRFTWNEDVMTGNGLEATPDLDYLEIKERVEAEVEDEGPTGSEVR